MSGAPVGAELWRPSPARAAGTQLAAFARAVEQRHGVALADGAALHAWSVAHLDALWGQAWEELGLQGDPGTVAFDPGDGSLLGGRFFPGARLSFTENLLAGLGAADGDDAIVWAREDGAARTMSWGELRSEVASAAAALRAAGVGPGDRVAAWMPNVPETVVVMAATLSLGALFSSTSPDFGARAVVDRFSQVAPTVLVAADGYLYGGRRFDRLAELAEIRAALPTVVQVVVFGHLDPEPDLRGVPDAIGFDAWLGAHPDGELDLPRFDFDHPGFVLYSSGTTGRPKCIVHRAAGVLLKHRVEHALQLDVRPGDRAFYFTTCGWMMWNWLTSALAGGTTIVLFEGNPTHPGPSTLFDLADEHRVTLFGVSARYLEAVFASGLRPRASHDLSALRTICSTGSPLAPSSFDHVYRDIKEDVHLASISGGTDLCGCLVAGDPTRPVFRGEIQAPVLGMAIDVFDDAGEPAPAPATGELVCTEPFPSMPVGFWGDADGARYRAAYFERFPGAWHQGDLAAKTPQGGFVIHGRSDDVLNVGGVRIGTAEIHAVVDAVDEVASSAVVEQHLADGTSRMVLLVQLAGDGAAPEDLFARLRAALRTECSPRHVPGLIAAVGDLPRTYSGKLSETAVADVLNGRPVRNADALANPAALEELAGDPVLRAGTADRPA